MLSNTIQKELKPQSFIIDTFDMSLYQEQLPSLQSQLGGLLRSLDGPTRFMTLHRHASLMPLIKWTVETARATNDPWRTRALMDYRAWYEDEERKGTFQRAICGMIRWTDIGMSPDAITGITQTFTGTRVYPSAWPPLIDYNYQLSNDELWHLAPVGYPSGRPYVTFLGSFEFHPVDWNFFRPLGSLYGKGIPFGLIVDIPHTYEQSEAVSKLEGILTATSAHLVTSKAIDSRSERQIQETQWALSQILNGGQQLHEVQIKIALFADSPAELKEIADEIKQTFRPFVKLRTEIGEAQTKCALYFAPVQTPKIQPKAPVHPMLSDGAALLLGFIGYKKLEPRRGIIRGFSNTGDPYIYDSWDMSRGKKATHEVWVGTTGSGKTFALNCYLSRSLAHHGISFDLLEPMGHGKLLAREFGITAHSLSAKHTVLNPHDPVYDQPGEQINHSIALYETFMQRGLSGTPASNIQRSLLGQAINYYLTPPEYRDGRAHELKAHDMREYLRAMRPSEAPTVTQVLSRLEYISREAKTPRARELGTELSDEIRGLATGIDTPYGGFLDGHTTIDFSISGQNAPRIISFDQMENNDILISIAYTQVLAALMRTAMADDTPRIIAVDEVYRMMRNPALMKFLIDAVKTLRTKRKKVIVIDQQMRIFVSDPHARLLFENCPIRVIFAQKGGEDVFYEDPAFGHYNNQHRETIRKMPPFHCLMETDEGIFFLNQKPASTELRRFGSS